MNQYINIGLKNILSFSGSVGFCSVSKAKIETLRIGLCEARHSNLRSIIVERDLAYAIRWALGVCSAPWTLVDIVEK